MTIQSADITGLLQRWKDGDRSVEDSLVSQLYPALRDLAAGQVRRHRGVLSLSATELVNEAYERLHRQQAVDWSNRGHFLAIAATVVRRAVVDHLRQRNAEKRGGDAEMISLDETGNFVLSQASSQIDWLAMDQALNALAEVDADSARLVELRVFGGFSVEEIAEISSSSVATVGRRWRFARAWLAERLEPTSD